MQAYREDTTHAVEPNSDLGQAISYLQNHWDKLTLFLRVPGAPLSKYSTDEKASVTLA